jgi:hypothetical protein
MRRAGRASILVASALAFLPARAHAILDVENNGPTLNAGAFAMRITNIGALGNPFEDVGRSFDPSFEYPRGSGNQGLKSADLWVGARRENGSYRVSGGPLLEWRPTLAADDHVRTVYSGLPGTQRYVDDDGDGRIDEERLNGRDDDGDGEIDEDLGIPGTQMLAAEYSDDRPEALAYSYPNGEPHQALGLDVYQEAFTWAQPGYDRVAGLHFVVHNHGSETLSDVRIGLLVDLDSRAYGDAGGHVNDVLEYRTLAVPYNDGVAKTDDWVTSVDANFNVLSYYKKSCTGLLTGEAAIVSDANLRSGLPAFGVVPLGHTVDVFAQLEEALLVDNRVEPYVVGPAHEHFQFHSFALDLPPGQGGLPLVDADRYRAMAGDYPGPPDLTAPHDYAVLVSCGPFRRLEKGRSFTFDLALVCGPSRDSVMTSAGLAASLHHGNWINLYPDTTANLFAHTGISKSGVSGHESFVSLPREVGNGFITESACWQQYQPNQPYPCSPPCQYPPGPEIELSAAKPRWMDADCDICTGFNGNETHAFWTDPVSVPPPPSYHASPSGRGVEVAWDNLPEIMLSAGVAGSGDSYFTGYNVYRLSDWHRKGLIPGPEKFQEVASFGVDTLQSERPLSAITDTTVDYQRILYDRKQYAMGRYRFVDADVTEGFDYLYVVTTVAERRYQATLGGAIITQRFESPIVSSLDSLVTPHDSARAKAGLVTVVPNPYRGGVVWDRQPVAGDTFGRHIDFIGLPRTRATIRIYTLAGDLVQSLDHDGAQGDGEARWNLISRNGQDVVSGVYLFTIDSSLGHQLGRFVVIR